MYATPDRRTTPVANSVGNGGAHVRRALLCAAVACLLAPATARAQVSAPQSAGSATFFACYVKNTGTVYRIGEPGTPARCRDGHIEFSWSEAGSVGPQGPAGPPGPGGPAGPPGPSSVRAFAAVSPHGVLDPNRSRGFVSVTTPSPGRYCLTPEPGISPDQHPILVSQMDELLAALSWDTEMVDAGVCAPGQYGIVGFSTLNGAPLSIGFTVIVP